MKTKFKEYKVCPKCKGSGEEERKSKEMNEDGKWVVRKYTAECSLCGGNGLVRN